MGCHVLDVRVVFRVGRHCGRGAGGVCHWHRDVGIDYLSFGVLRNERAAADLRASQPLWRNGAGAVDGQDWPARTERGRLRADFRVHCRARHPRPWNAAGRSGGVYLFTVA